MRLYTLTVLDLFSGEFIDSIPFQTPFPIDLDMVDFDELAAVLGFGFNTGMHEMFVTEQGFVSELPVVEF